MEQKHKNLFIIGLVLVLVLSFMFNFFFTNYTQKKTVQALQNYLNVALTAVQTPAPSSANIADPWLDCINDCINIYGCTGGVMLIDGKCECTGCGQVNNELVNPDGPLGNPAVVTDEYADEMDELPRVAVDIGVRELGILVECTPNSEKTKCIDGLERDYAFCIAKDLTIGKCISGDFSDINEWTGCYCKSLQ